MTKDKMAKFLDYIPIDKSWIMRMGILDIIWNYDGINKFLEKQKDLGEDLVALKRVAEKWNSNEPLDVGESGTLYRFTRFASWKYGKKNEIIKRGTLINRKICDNPEIINWPLEKLLKLDNGTSQWASASVLMGNTKKIENPPVKLQLTYEAVKHWHSKRIFNKSWEPKYDETIKKQALSFINSLRFNLREITNFTIEHAEDYCFARGLELMSKEKGLERFPQIVNHETNRIEEMEKVVDQANNNKYIDSKDHRVVQAYAMRQTIFGKEIKVKDKSVVNKSWPQFWDFLEYAKTFKR